MIVILYCVVSLIVGIADVTLVNAQDTYLSTIPTGDIGYYIKPKKIIGIHNVILLPSLIVIGTCWLIHKLGDD